MPGPKRNRLAEILDWAGRRNIEMIGRREFSEVRELLRTNDSQLRRLLRATGLGLSPWAEGVRQDSFEQLRRTLESLQAEYEAARSAGDLDYGRELRQVVITAKDHARLASRRMTDSGRRAEKEEMVEWMLVWLENPTIFTDWARLRVRTKNR